MHFAKKFFIRIYICVAVILLLSSTHVFAENPPLNRFSHTVIKGESLSIISKKYNCSVNDIKKWNNLSSELIHPGQKLLLENENTGNFEKQNLIYIVKKGDCLSTIAQKNRCSIDEIKKLNNLTSSKLNIGQQLLLNNSQVRNIKIAEEADSLPVTIKNDSAISSDVVLTVNEVHTADSIISFAYKFIGKPYRSKIENFIFDCSGYVSYIYSKFGITLPRSSPAQALLGERLEIKDLKKGDLVFFTGHNSKSKRVGHVGMVVSADGTDFTMIHSSTHRGIVVESFKGNPYFEKRYITARRIPFN